MPLAKVTSKGQVTIPVEIRKSLNIQEGDNLMFDSSDEVATLRVIKNRKLTEFRGVFSRKQNAVEKKKLRESMKREIARRISQE